MPRRSCSGRASAAPGPATGTLNLNGGLVTAGTLTLGNAQFAAATGIFKLNGGGTLNAGKPLLPAPRAGAGPFNWINGTIQNYDANTDLTVSGLTLTDEHGGTHAFNISVGRTASVGAILAETGGFANLYKTGAGTLVLSITNTYTGATTIDAGTLQIGNGGSGEGLASNWPSP